MIRFTSHKWNTICRRFNCFISGSDFIYCRVIEIAVGRSKNYIETAYGESGRCRVYVTG